MGRHVGAVCRLCRREGIKLFLKGARCDSPKCAVERRDSPPGMHSWRRGKVSDYSVHLREKQKVKRYYGVQERQFLRYFGLAERSRGHTGDVLLSLLERRLDNVVHRLGFARSRKEARQLITHGHVLVNGRWVNVAGYLLRAGDRVGIKNQPRALALVRGNVQQETGQLPAFLERTSEEPPEGRLVRLPDATDASLPVQAQLIIELCSR